MLRLEGRSGNAFSSTCSSCKTPDPIYRCMTCFGPDMYCLACTLKCHATLPTHWINEWNGLFFERRSLTSLGLVVQLGHPAVEGCPNATNAHEKFTVIDVTSIHLIKLHFCKCDSRIEHRQQLMWVRWWPATARDPQICGTFAVLKLFVLANYQGKITAHDFLKSLELLTNNVGLNPPPPRHRAFHHMGELALRCRAYPQPGINILPGWEKIDWGSMPEDLRYKFFLFLAQDCNFGLINRNVSTDDFDPILTDRMGYFVNMRLYTAFLKEHVTEEEISTCSGFRAMFMANSKRGKRLRTTGVGGMTCRRHNMWCPNGIGDLQLGEHHCNMDFILFSSLLNTILLYLILSYDIACQYSKKIRLRMPGLPPQFHLNMKRENFWFKVPNFHLPGHKPLCHLAFSFHWMWGAGRTHGETIEQNWEFTNSAVSSTKMMGCGARHATLEDLFGYHNWRWTEHRDAFDAFDTALSEAVPEMTALWRAWVQLRTIKTRLFWDRGKVEYHSRQVFSVSMATIYGVNLEANHGIDTSRLSKFSNFW
ncbi:hypothetical protein C8R44DRAFT_836773 [Mycena epipterygia]|nr:hypothetical protein C8R44DRAFT_836773 [Mycena epipterygia]